MLRELTPTWDTKIKATNASVRPGDGVYPFVTCAVVLIKLANPKSAPAVIATWPIRLNLEAMSVGRQ